MTFLKNLLTLIILLFLLLPSKAQQTSGDDFRDRAIRILEEVPLIDGHNDVPIQYRNRSGYDFSKIDLMNTRNLQRPMHTDIPRLRDGRVGGQFWSVYVSPNTPESESVLATMEQIDFVHRMIERYPDHFDLALTADDIERIFSEGKIASLIGMEGGHSIGNSLGALRMFYELGARYMGLTHSRSLDWADSATDDPVSHGLSDFGREVVREMNRIGMLVDLSHVSKQTMVDAIQVSAAPVIFSHSSASAVTEHSRNVPDEVLHMVKENNGIVMVTFVPVFVSENLRIHQERRSAERNRLNEQYPGDNAGITEKLSKWDMANPAHSATLGDVADHIDHIRDLIGSEHIGIGGDYDGIRSLPVGLEDVSTYPDLFAELLRRGYSESELKNIAGLNVLRVMRDAESVSRKLRRETDTLGIRYGQNVRGNGNEAGFGVSNGTANGTSHGSGDITTRSHTHDYPNSGLLIQSNELQKLLENNQSKTILLIDARPETDGSVIPGAVHFPAVAKLTDPEHPVASYLVGPEIFESMMREIGLMEDHRVVIYDHGNSLAAARLFYALDYYGFANASILNGGFDGWLAEEFPTGPDAESSEKGNFTVEVREEKFCSFEYVLAASGQSDKIIFDARSEDEFTGEDERAAYSGHIPNAVNLEWSQVLRKDGIPYFLPAADISELYSSLGITPDKEVIPHCHTNVRGSHAYFTLRLMGFDSVRAYEGSWSEYGNRDDAVIQKP